VQALQARAAAAGLGAQVLLPGHEADGATALAAADIVLAPSIEPEAFGRAVVEAQAMARPVVATALGGHLETVLDGDTGRLVPAGDAAAMAQAVAALLANPEGAAAMGARAAVRVRAAFTTRALQDATLDVYARLVPGFPCAA
jgi:glycosyltransferase involved in cell wall biosynthesis